MAEPFKNFLDAHAVGRLADLLAASSPAFARNAFAAAATDGLAALELKARVRHIADHLRAALPSPWPEAAGLLVAALPPPLPDDTRLDLGFWLWPVLAVVEHHGAHDPEASLPALHEMTRRFSAEFAIRPLIARHPEPSWAALLEWTGDPNVHVRRLASEGSRPRLPWGQRLVASVADPSRGLALLDRLVDDPSAYVRRSVANHLGDVAKDHPELALEVAQRWVGARPQRMALVTHGLRDLLKRGHRGALALVGHESVPVSVERLQVTPPRARPGESVEVSAQLRVAQAASLRVDVVWSWPGLRGGWASKTFRGSDRRLAAGETWDFRHRLPLRVVSTRPLRPGEQRVVLRILGEDFGPVSFWLDL